MKDKAFLKTIFVRSQLKFKLQKLTLCFEYFFSDIFKQEVASGCPVSVNGGRMCTMHVRTGS